MDCCSQHYLFVSINIDDITQFLHFHPGGPSLVKTAIGTDVSHLFQKRKGSLIPQDLKTNSSKETSTSIIVDKDFHWHSRLAHSILSSMAVGRLKIGRWLIEDDDDEKGKLKDVEREFSSAENINEVISQQFVIYKVRRELSNSPEAKNKVYKLKLIIKDPSIAHIAPGKLVYFQFLDSSNRWVTRPYTPIRYFNSKYIEFFVKVYYDGTMSKHLETCTSIRMSIQKDYSTMPVSLRCLGAKKFCWTELGMICGGTGLTLMVQKSNLAIND